MAILYKLPDGSEAQIFILNIVDSTALNVLIDKAISPYLQFIR